MCMNSHAHYTYMSLLEEECADERKSAEELPVLDKQLVKQLLSSCIMIDIAHSFQCLNKQIVRS